MLRLELLRVTADLQRELGTFFDTPGPGSPPREQLPVSPAERRSESRSMDL